MVGDTFSSLIKHHLPQSYSKKMKTHKPKSTIEAINDLQQFLECDLYTLFRPKQIIKGKAWYRDKPFKDENQFHKYLEEHFELLRKQIKELNNKS